MVNVSPSTSLSLLSTGMLIAWSLFVAALSLTATGASFTEDHGDADGCWEAIIQPVVGFIGEAIGAVVIGNRRVLQFPHR